MRLELRLRQASRMFRLISAELCITAASFSPRCKETSVSAGHRSRFRLQAIAPDFDVAAIGRHGGKRLTLQHVSGPIGVRGRNSDNTLIEDRLRWRPTEPLVAGLRKLYPWIADRVQASRTTQAGRKAT